MSLKKPDFMPIREPNQRLVGSALEYRNVPGVSFHRDGDGILYYYDQPLMFVAWYREQMMFVNLIDEDFQTWPLRPRGWQQFLLIPTTHDLIKRAENSEIPLRALFEQPAAKDAKLLHRDWVYLGEFNEQREWFTVSRVFDAVHVQDAWKSNPGVYLNPEKKDA